MGRPCARAVVLAGDRPVCERCDVADNPWTRLRGLLGRARLSRGDGLIIRPTSAIHTYFMRFPIDALFLDRDLVVVRVVPELRPWRVAGRRGAKAVLELAAGESRRRGIGVGERLRIDDPAWAE